MHYVAKRKKKKPFNTMSTYIMEWITRLRMCAFAGKIFWLQLLYSGRVLQCCLPNALLCSKQRELRILLQEFHYFNESVIPSFILLFFPFIHNLHFHADKTKYFQSILHGINLCSAHRKLHTFPIRAGHCSHQSYGFTSFSRHNSSLPGRSACSLAHTEKHLLIIIFSHRHLV